MKIRQLKRYSPYRVLVHWAGYKRHTPLDLIRNAHILRYFESLYYSRIPNVQLERKARPTGQIAKVLSDLRQKWPGF